MTRPDCGSCRELCPELALGLVTGRERADALTHLQGCEGCRKHLAGLTRLHDELLAVIPDIEPPPGFETRVLARLDTTPDRRRPPIPATIVATALAAAVIAAAVIAGAVIGGATLTGSFNPATDTAASPVAAGVRPVLFAPLLIEGREIGKVYAYPEKPSWLYLYLDTATGQRPLTCTLLRRDGTTTIAASFPVLDGNAFWGGPVSIDRATLAGVRVTDDTGAVLASAGFDGPR
jgi:hypothetical protein